MSDTTNGTRPPQNDAQPGRAELETARNLLAHYGHRDGWQGGSFTTALITALEKADTMNRSKLLSAFPEYRAPVSVLMTRGVDALAEWVKMNT